MDWRNVILYCTDEQRADLLGCMGHTGSELRTSTPWPPAAPSRRGCNIQGTVCMPSRAVSQFDYG